MISGWKDLGRYGCLAKGKRNESADCGQKQRQPCAGLFRRRKERTFSSEIAVARH